MNRFFSLFGLLVAVSILVPANVFASEYSVRPFLIDATLTPRESKVEMVQLTNGHPAATYKIFATVNEIEVDTEGEIKEFVPPVISNQSITVTSWIEVTRGRIEVPAGEKLEVPITLNINPFAKPGEYHAFVGFVPAKNRPTAEQIALEGDAPGVVVKITIADQREDGMRISSFLVNRFITNDEKREIDIVVENTGDISSAPTGEVIFYNSRGIEVAAVDVNTENSFVDPGQSLTLKSTIPLDSTLGRFKANVQLEYGENARNTLYDTATFYLMPLHILLLIFGSILLGAIFVALLFRKVILAHQHDRGHEDLPLYVSKEHTANPKDHDIHLTKDSQ